MHTLWPHPSHEFDSIAVTNGLPGTDSITHRHCPSLTLGPGQVGDEEEEESGGGDGGKEGGSAPAALLDSDGKLTAEHLSQLMWDQVSGVSGLLWLSAPV